MSPAKFDAVVQRLSDLSRRSPRGYRWRLIGLACLGYAYVLAVLLALLAAALAPFLIRVRGLGAFTFKFEALLFGLAYAIVRAIWVRVPPEEGLELTRDRVPALFDAIEQVRTAMDAPRVHKIVLDSGLNAGVRPVPRFGMLGQRNHLTLGLPLLQTLSPVQFEAVLAHELGHLSHRHGRFGAWIYRIRMGWNRLDALTGESSGFHRFVFGAFLRWYAPRFSAYSFVQARAQEYEADRSAAEAFGASQLASALVSIRLAGAFLQKRYWPSILSQVERTPEPPASPYSKMTVEVATHLSSRGAEADLGEALEEKTTSADTHPCLRDRLEALGESAVVVPAPEESAAAVLLGDQLEPLTSRFDEEWTRTLSEGWKDRHESVTQARGELETLRQKPEQERTADDWWQLTSLTHSLDGGDAALPLSRRLVELFPDHRAGRFVLGALLLERDDGAGLEHLKAGIEDNPAATVDSWNLAYQFLRRHGRDAEAEALYESALATQDVLRQAERDRYRIDGKTTYTPHDLPDDAVASIVAALAAKRAVKRAYLARKVANPSETLYVLAVLRRSPWYRYERGNENERFLREVIASLGELPFDLQCYVSSRRRELRRISKVVGAQIHPAASRVGA